jgi:hypothetical protein
VRDWVALMKDDVKVFKARIAAADVELARRQEEIMQRERHEEILQVQYEAELADYQGQINLLEEALSASDLSLNREGDQLEVVRAQ